SYLQDGGIDIDQIKHVRLLGQAMKGAKVYVVIECKDPFVADMLKREIVRWIPQQQMREVSRVEFYQPMRLRSYASPTHQQRNQIPNTIVRNDANNYLRAATVHYTHVD